MDSSKDVAHPTAVVSRQQRIQFRSSHCILSRATMCYPVKLALLLAFLFPIAEASAVSVSKIRRSSQFVSTTPQERQDNGLSFLDTARRKIYTQPRGGAAAAAIKTMSARQMEALNLLSGGAAGTVAACITNPLDVIKTQLQSSTSALGEFAAGQSKAVAIARKIMQVDGLSGFFRGLPPTLVGIIPSRSAYFYAYQRSKTALSGIFPEGSPPNALISGLLAGLTGNTLTNPIWMVRTRMQLSVDAAAGQVAYKGYGDVIATIFREEGVKGFYKGIQASYWGCTEGAVQFLIYEQLKTRLLKQENERRAAQGRPPTTELSHMTYFWSAAAAKMFAAIGTYPHEVARTRMREQARSGVFKYRGMWQTIGVVAREEGRQGLYSGMGVHLMKVVPNSALMFLTYEVVRRWLDGFTVSDQ